MKFDHLLLFSAFFVYEEDTMSRMVIDDDIWARLEPLLPKPKGRPGKDDRLFIEGICWVLRTGAPWRDLPSD
jgi:transposase